MIPRIAVPSILAAIVGLVPVSTAHAQCSVYGAALIEQSFLPDPLAGGTRSLTGYYVQWTFRLDASFALEQNGSPRIVLTEEGFRAPLFTSEESVCWHSGNRVYIKQYNDRFRNGFSAGFNFRDLTGASRNYASVGFGASVFDGKVIAGGHVDCNHNDGWNTSSTPANPFQSFYVSRSVPFTYPSNVLGAYPASEGLVAYSTDTSVLPQLTTATVTDDSGPISDPIRQIRRVQDANRRRYEEARRARRPGPTLKITDSVRAAFQESQEYQALSVADREAIDTILEAFQQYETDPLTGQALQNLALLLEKGGLKDPRVRLLLQTLARELRRDAARGRGEQVSDAVLLLSDLGRVLRRIDQIGAPVTPLAERLKRAREIAAYVRGKLESDNLGINRLSPSAHESVERVRSESKSRFGTNGLPDPSGAPSVRAEQSRIVALRAEIAAARGAGNCQECAFLAAVQLKAAGFKNVEIVSRNLDQPGGGHVFVVVGRDPFADITNPASYGKDAIIVDPYYGTAFPADQSSGDTGVAEASNLRLPDQN